MVLIFGGRHHHGHRPEAMLREFFNEHFFSPSSKNFFAIGDNELSKSWQVSNMLFPCSENRPYICYWYTQLTYDRNNIK